MTEYDLIRAIEKISESINVLSQPRMIDWITVALSSISILVSGAAIGFAIRVASKQNKIELFEKRYRLYNVLCPMLDFGARLGDVKEVDLTKMGKRLRSEYYLALYTAGKGLDFVEVVDLGLTFRILRDENNNYKSYEMLIDENNNYQSYEIQKRRSNDFTLYKELGSKVDSINIYKLQLRQNINTNSNVIEFSSFLFPKKIKVLLQKLATSYSEFMNLIYFYLMSKNSAIENSELVPCDIEKKKEEFLNIIKEMSDKHTLKKIETYLKIKE